MTKRLVLWIGVLVLLLAACSGEELETGPVVGALAPDFKLQNLEGETVFLSDHLGQVVLVNFWATWCGPCIVEMPEIQERYEKYAPELVVLALDFDEPKEIVQVFVDDLGLTFPILMDEGGVIQQEYLVRGYPSSYFVDREGVIQVVHIGFMVGEQMDAYLEKAGIKIEK